MGSMKIKREQKTAVKGSHVLLQLKSVPSPITDTTMESEDDSQDIKSQSNAEEEGGHRKKLLEDAKRLTKKLKVLKNGELEFKMVFCLWGKAEAVKLFSHFHHFNQDQFRDVTSVNISHVDEFGVEAIKTLLTPWNSSLKKLELQGLKDDDLEGLQDSILQLTSLQELVLGCCPFLSAASIPTLTKLVKGSKNLVKLTLNDNQELFHNAQVEAVRPLALALLKQPLTHLEFRRCRLAGEVADTMMDAVTGSKKLDTLTIITEMFSGDARNHWKQDWTQNLLKNIYLHKLNIDTCNDLNPPNKILKEHCKRNKQHNDKRKKANNCAIELTNSPSSSTTWVWQDLTKPMRSKDTSEKSQGMSQSQQNGEQPQQDDQPTTTGWLHIMSHLTCFAMS